MIWWDALTLIGLASLVVGIAGGEVTLLRSLPWGENWDVGGYF